MPNSRFVVAPGQEFSYPADASSLHIVKNAGGLSKLTPEQSKMVKYKTVKEGQDCSDMPAGSLEIFLSRGWVIQIEETEKTPVLEDEGGL